MRPPGWTMHQQAPWEERAKDPNVPLWLRVTFLAMGTHKKNGHASFLNAEEVAVRSTPMGKPTPDASEIRRAVRLARDRGWLSPQSNPKCLVVPPHWIDGGTVGHAYAGCHLHTGGL